MAITPMKNGILGPNRGSMWPQEWDIWLFAILFMTISYLNKKPLYLFPKTPRSDLKCQHSIEVKKEKFSAFWHFLRCSNLQSLKKNYCVRKWKVHLNILSAFIEAFGKTFISNHIKVSYRHQLNPYLKIIVNKISKNKRNDPKMTSIHFKI